MLNIETRKLDPEFGSVGRRGNQFAWRDRDFAREARDADRLEMQRAGYASMDIAIDECIRGSDDVYRMRTEDGRPFAIFGFTAGSMATRIGYPWLVTCDAVEEDKRRFVREGRQYLRKMFDKCDRMLVFVDAEYKAAHRWMRHVGFVLHRAEAYGPSREPFYRATLSRTDFIMRGRKHV